MTLRDTLLENADELEYVTLNAIYLDLGGNEHIFVYTGYVVTPRYIDDHLPKKILDSQVVRISHGKKWGINSLGQIVKIDAEIYILF